MLTFKNLGQAKYEQTDLEKKFKTSESRFQEIRFYDSLLFYRSFIRVKFVDMQEIAKAFLRVESGESGDLPTHAVYLILIDHQNREISLHMERMDTAKKMIAYMEDTFPAIQYGFTK